MSTKNVTSSTNQYDPGSLNTYHSLLGPATQQLGSQITNPYNNPLMTNLRAQGNVAQAGFFRGPQSFTGSNNAAFQRARLQFGGDMNRNLLISGAQLRNQAITGAMNFRPLQTGGKQVESTYGAGTWAGPLIGLGIAGAEAFAGMPPKLGSSPFFNSQNVMSSFNPTNAFSPGFSQAPSESYT